MKWRRHVVLVVAALAGAGRTVAQMAPAGWAVGAGAYWVSWSETGAQFDHLSGPALQVHRLTPRGIGFDLQIGYLTPTGFYDLTGLTGALGVSLGLPAGRHLLQLKTGGTVMAGGDSDGSFLAAGGPYAGGAAVVRIRGRVGLHVEALVRDFVGSSVAPSLSAAVLLLPHARP